MDGKQLVLCLAFSTVSFLFLLNAQEVNSYVQANEWDPQHVIITGSNDGVVRVSTCQCHINANQYVSFVIQMWSLEFVQQPDDSHMNVLNDGVIAGEPPRPRTAAGMLSTGSTAAGELVSMVDPHGMLASCTNLAAANNDDADDERLRLDLDALRRRLVAAADQDGDGQQPSPPAPLSAPATAAPDQPPRFRVGAGTPSDCGDSGTSIYLPSWESASWF